MAYQESQYSSIEKYEAGIRRNKIRNSVKTWSKDPDNKKVVDFLEGYSSVDCRGFYNDLYRSLYTYGKLSKKQVQAVLQAIEKSEAKWAELNKKIEEQKSKSNFIGEVGDKVELFLTINKIIVVEGKSFSYYDSGISYLHIMSCGDNIVIYRGKSNIGDEKDEIKLKCSIKTHQEYQGAKQTVIQRPKVIG